MIQVTVKIEALKNPNGTIVMDLSSRNEGFDATKEEEVFLSVLVDHLKDFVSTSREIIEATKKMIQKEKKPWYKRLF
jgi:hypothetical protein